ncbi:MAG: 1-phosphofructokinase family hexose kinase [Phycisphaerae bacterium]
MSRKFSIITVGLSPAWDITCRGRGLDWSVHGYIDEQIIQPAGKALNISKALAWMGQRNIAAGLWGRNDYQQMVSAVQSLWPLIKVKMTPVSGSTRQNVTIVDTVNHRDMHLRNRSKLVSRRALKRLKADLQAIVNSKRVCVFAGAMPEDKLWGDIIRIIKGCHRQGARMVLDTSGAALREIIDTGGVWLIKPNVNELRELLGDKIKDNPFSLAKAGQKLLEKVEIVLISRGKKGAVVVSKDGAWQGRCIARRKTLSTVGCGDYLLAGFIKCLTETFDAGIALQTAIRVATARAWGWTESKKWPQAERQIKVKTKGFHREASCGPQSGVPKK